MAANGDRKWKYTKEAILMVVGIFLLVYEAIFAGSKYHFEFVTAGLALCGISLFQIGDKK